MGKEEEEGMAGGRKRGGGEREKGHAAERADLSVRVMRVRNGRHQMTAILPLLPACVASSSSPASSRSGWP